MATVMASSLLAASMIVAAVTFGRSTFTLLFNMGVMTMKIIRSTSMTSTMGVTLMFEFTFLPSSRFEIAIRVLSVGTRVRGAEAAVAGLEGPHTAAGSLAVRLLDKVVH